MTSLWNEFDLAYRNRTTEHRQHLADAGITFEAMLRAGNLGVERIATIGRGYMPSPEGFPAVILAIWSPAPPSIYCAIDDPEIVDLMPDGATVCDQPDHGCLIFYGNGRRMAAANALEGIGIAPPRWWEL